MVIYMSAVERLAYVALAQPDRVFGYEPKGRGFESLMPRQKDRFRKKPVFFDFGFAWGKRICTKRKKSC